MYICNTGSKKPLFVKGVGVEFLHSKVMDSISVTTVEITNLTKHGPS